MTTTGITTELQSLSPTAVIELFVLDMSSIGAASLYFHAGTNGLLGNIIWQGNTYTAFPVEAEGFAAGTINSLPRPKFRLVNKDGAFSATVEIYGDLLGFGVTRKRTMMKFLDAANFAGSVNASADPNQHYPDDLWFVDQKTHEDRDLIEWELASVFDLMGVMLPARQITQNYCPWVYKGPECSYTGTNYLTTMDVPTTSNNDVCSKRLGSCKLRFGPNAVLPFGGFPGSIKF